MNRRELTALIAPLLFVAGMFGVNYLVTPHAAPVAAAVATEHGDPALPYGKNATPTLPAGHTHTNTTVVPGDAAPVATGTAVTINGRIYIPCVTEDYEGPQPCFWDAGARSNGAGFSFLYDGSGTTYLTAGTAPCATEDYDGPEACFWDASKTGNGSGRSFLWTGTEVLYNVG